MLVPPSLQVTAAFVLFCWGGTLRDKTREITVGTSYYSGPMRNGTLTN